MTLVDLCRLIGRYWKLVVALPVVAVIAAAAVLFVPSQEAVSNTATSRIVVNSQVAITYGHAASLARQAANADSEYTVQAKVDSASMTVSIIASGPNPDECVQLADAVATDATAITEQDFLQNEGSEYKTAYRAQIEPALLDENTASGGKLKYLAVALLGGLFVAICIVVIIDMRRRHVKSAEGAQEAVGLPVLEILPVKDGGERLFANVRFAAKKDDLKSVCVIPAGQSDAARQACETIEQGARGVGASTVVACYEPLSASMDGAYKAREADAVVVTARQWEDSLTQLETTVAELKLADANLVGVVYAKA